MIIYDIFQVFSCIWIKNCKFSSSRFLKFRIFTFPMAILSISYTGNELGKLPKMAYFWSKLAIIGPKMPIFGPFFDQKHHFSTNFCVKTSRNYEKLENFSFMSPKMPKNGQFWAKKGHFDFWKWSFLKVKIAKNCLFWPKIAHFLAFLDP